mmetsp:Transcript_6918/g.26145  ORF Transcript_6918/g.26145 Transcript_6918/m.26145 type:complete len:222 (-) Transcript_6918:91-756(-)
MKFGSLSWYSFWIHSSTTSFELAAGGGRVVWEFTVSASPVSQSLTGSSATTSPRPRPYPKKFRRGSNLVTNRAPDRFWKRPECRFDFLFASASDHSLTPLPPSPSAARFWNRPRCTSANVWFPLIFGFVTSLWFSSHTRDSQLPSPWSCSKYCSRSFGTRDLWSYCSGGHASGAWGGGTAVTPVRASVRFRDRISARSFFAVRLLIFPLGRCGAASLKSAA